jgi:hypothetical protein
MITVHRVAGFKFCFHSGFGAGRPHVYVKKESSIAKYTLDSVMLQSNDGFTRTELGRIEQLVLDNRNILMQQWTSHVRNPI